MAIINQYRAPTIPGAFSGTSTSAGTTAPQPSGYRAANTFAQPVAPVNADGQVTATQGYQATQLGDPTRWDVTPDQTVQGQIKGIIASNSPLLQQAQSRAAQVANSRGLLNSSMAVSAGESALYDAALPIASADASTYARAAGYNADEKNIFSLRNADALDQASAFNAGEVNRAGLTNAQNATQVRTTRMNNDTSRDVANIGAEAQRYSSDRQYAGTVYSSDKDYAGRVYSSDRSLEGTRYSSDRQLEGTRYASDNSLRGTMYGADRQLEGTRYSSDRQLEGTRYASDRQLEGQHVRANADISVANIGASAQRDVASINQQTQKMVQQLSNDGRIAAANVEGQWRNLIQTNGGAADVMRQYIANLAEIDTSNMSVDGKAIAQQNQNNWVANAMNTLSVTGNIPQLSAIWSVPQESPSAPAPAAAPAYIPAAAATAAPVTAPSQAYLDNLLFAPAD